MLKEYDKSYEANIPLLIDYYLNFLNSRNVDDIKSENFNRVITSLKNELISIKNLIFSGTVAESDLVHIFKKMVFSTTNLLYTAYGAKLGEDKVTRIGLRQTMLNAHLYSIKNAITSSIYKYRMAVGSTAVSSKYEVGDFKLTGIVGSDKITEITITRGDKAITLRANKYNPDIRKMVSSVEGKPELSSEDLIILMKDICGIMLPDNFISVCESMGYKSFSDGDTKYSNKDIKTVLYRCLIPVIRFGIFHQPFGDNGGMFASSKTGNYNLPVKHSSTFYDNIRDLANIQARIMGNTSKSIIFGIDGKNTLPVYGCTNEGSRIMELGRKLGKNNSEARKHGFTAHTDEDGRKNPYERNILTTAVKGEFLYSHVENRSSILVGKKLTSISKATVKDVLRTEIDHEFIDAMENGASSIGVQTATHADKSNQGVHYFNLAYELSANGKTKTLGKAIKEIYDGAVSQSNLDETMLMQVMYACRHKRYKAIRENLLADYEAALG